MKKLLIACVLVGVGGFLLPPQNAHSTPHIPDTGSVDPAAFVEAGSPDAKHPGWLVVPAIGLETPIVPVGKNRDGEMDVPDGSADTVGWYEDGPVPGQRGSAVLAAHVYAAFSELDRLTGGEEIHILTRSGESRRFIVEEVKLTTLEETSAHFLFERDDDERLNLITCAGVYLPGKKTYSHRLIVYARLAD